MGGDNAVAISVADPTLCPHLQSDIIPNRIQLNKDFIKNANMFVAYNDSNDRKYNIPAINDYMKANNYGTVTWKTISNPSRGWNTPTNSKLLAKEVLGWLVEKDPGNKTYYEQRHGDYVKTFDSVEPTDAEKQMLNKTKVIVMLWQQDPVKNWLGMDVVNIFAPDFAMNGTKTPAKVVDDINANPDKYKDVAYIIENMQSGELAKGIEEALHDKGINAKRVIFTNFPGSVEGADTMAEVLSHNKHLVLQQIATPKTMNITTPANSATTDKNGTFSFTDLSPGNYTLTAYMCILGAMHFLGDSPVMVIGNVENVTLKLSRSNETCYSDFQNATVNLTRGNYSISGTVYGGNRPGAEPTEIPYEDAQVKITRFSGIDEKA
jgi:zinc/manganese transport system substrate-binding protein